MEPPPYTLADFHHVVRKQLATAASSALADAKMRDSELDAILYSARALTAGELERDARLSLHGLDLGEDGELAPAEEAYLSVSAGGEHGEGEWLSLSYWLSDLALADRDPERVRATIAAIERSLAKLNAWLAEQDAPPVTEPKTKSRAKRAPKLTKSAESPDS
jgi:hypothetical protein